MDDYFDMMAQDGMEEQEFEDALQAAEFNQQLIEEREQMSLAEAFEMLDRDPGYVRWMDRQEEEENQRRHDVLTVWDF